MAPRNALYRGSCDRNGMRAEGPDARWADAFPISLAEQIKHKLAVWTLLGGRCQCG